MMKSAKEIGQILKEARQKKGLNLERVYKATRIPARVADLLEQGRANEALSRIYIISFLKKYAFFLDLDGNALASDYKKFHTDKEKQVFTLGTEKSGPNTETQKWMVFAVISGFVFIAVFFILFLGIRIKASRPVPAVEKKAVAVSVAPKQKPLFPLPDNKPIELTLAGTDSVWMRIKKDGKKVFEGTLEKNKEKTLSAKKEIELWVGRAEALNFTINGRHIGKVGRGSVKNISITRNGVKAGNRRLFGSE